MTDRNTDRSTVVVTDSGGRGSSAGVLVGIVLIIVVLAAIWFFALRPGSGGKTDLNVNVNLPSIGAPAASAAPS